jgi:LacI family transcriptional regulator, repressor for deo operon, udp, cdd, tsx, nupC, and nupG
VVCRGGRAGASCNERNVPVGTGSTGEGTGTVVLGITIRDVAREAGVSTATVSRALRGLPNVDPITREHVRRVADRLDYVISPAASRLASGRAGSIAVITPFVGRWYFSKVLTGVERVLQRSDLDLLLYSTGDPSEAHRVPPHRRLRRRVDGVLVIGLPAESPDLQELFELDLPVTLIGSHSAGVASVSIDDVEGARMATQHLVNLGHELIGLISGRPLPTPYFPENDRLAGYQQALSASGLRIEPTLQVPGHFTIEGGEHAMTAQLAQQTPPTAVFAMSDEMAFGALRALRRHGLKPGRDVSIVGFDGHEMSDLLDLTTIWQPAEELGALAARYLLDLLEDPRGETQVRRLPTQLYVRGSTALHGAAS